MNVNNREIKKQRFNLSEQTHKTDNYKETMEGYIVHDVYKYSLFKVVLIIIWTA